MTQTTHCSLCGATRHNLYNNTTLCSDCYAVEMLRQDLVEARVDDYLEAQSA